MSYIGNTPFTAAFLTDTFSGNGSTVAFTMTVAPASTSAVIVAITGVLQDPSTYSVSGTTLTFSAAPPTGTSNISVRYLGIPASGVATTAYRTVTNTTATAGQTSFSIPSYTVGYVDVYRNGVYLPTTDYTATTGTTVVLNNAATVGDTITTVSFYVSSVLNAIPATASSVSSTYLVDSSVTTAKIADANVTQVKLGTNVAGNGPAFSAYASTTQSISSATFTKVTFGAEDYDTNSNFASSTFTPTVAGYYQINVTGNYAGSGSPTRELIALYKNGSVLQRLVDSSAFLSILSGSIQVYMNGSTDYLEVYAYMTSTGTTVISSTSTSETFRFNGFLARSA